MEARRALALVMIVVGLVMVPFTVLDPFDTKWEHDVSVHRWDIDDDWSIEWEIDEISDSFEINLTDGSGIVLGGVFED